MGICHNHFFLDKLGLEVHVREVEPVARPADDLEGYPAFRTKERKAIHVLFNSMSKQFQSLVLAQDTITGFWMPINRRFNGTDANITVISLTEELISKCEESGDVNKRISSLNVHFAQLERMGILFHDQVKIGILYGVSPSYMKETKKLLDETKNTSYSYACNAFMHAYNNKKMSSGDQALLTCYKCGQHGHMAGNCKSNNNYCNHCRITGHTRKFCRILGI